MTYTMGLCSYSRPRNFPSVSVLLERTKYFCANFGYILCYVRFA